MELNHFVLLPIVPVPAVLVTMPVPKIGAVVLNVGPAVKVCAVPSTAKVSVAPVAGIVSTSLADGTAGVNSV